MYSPSINPYVLRDLFDSILINNAKKATKYISENLVVKMTVKDKGSAKEKHMEIILTIGKPNYQERKFIKDAKKAKKPFPIRETQIVPFKK